MKFFLLVSGFQDCLKIQSDLKKTVRQKLIAPQFAKSRHLLESSYMLGGTVLDRVSSINDLGVIMDEKITFSEHDEEHGCKSDARICYTEYSWTLYSPTRGVKIRNKTNSNYFNFRNSSTLFIKFRCT
jgi:hypothetical protein